MTDPEALKLFQTRSGRHQSEQPSDEERELLNILDSLPLAIAQAAAYMRLTRASVKYYVEMLKESEVEQS